jgi:WXG100 family type VII secretion target
MTNPPSAPITVRPELEVAGQRLNQQAQQIAGELASLASFLDSLPQVWSGSAAAQFGDLQQRWNTAADGLFGPDGVLGTIAAAMHANWSAYSDAEWTNSQVWSRNGGGA